MTYFSKEDTLATITDNYPETIAVFTAHGFPQMGDEVRRRLFAPKISLESALTLKGTSVTAFTRLLEAAIEQRRNGADVSLQAAGVAEAGASLSIHGVLPCPVRIPLLESFQRFAEGYRHETGLALRAELQAASMGVDGIARLVDQARDAADLPDLFISAGFDLFFDRQRFGRFKADGVFADLVKFPRVNASFAGLDLPDPDGHYSLLAVVPAVFLVNTEELHDEAVPRGWEDLLDARFTQRVSLPVGDFDLFNAILLHIHHRFGDDGVQRLSRNMLSSLHPAQMVKSDRRKDQRPAVTIMPNFFTRMVKDGGPMQAVWPADGAIISPVFMLAQRAKRAALQPVADFFASREVGEILAHQGLFPSLHPDVDNRLPADRPFMWLGWNTINGQDLSVRLRHCLDLFQLESTGGVS
ncbi:MAG: ABC transporter substrate-binding protein [Acidobacteria bacterium]|nr:ABC transporter substrate-binding protein [Acidobacteriota bacterium]